MPTDQITIRGAREHNLKNITLSIPRDKLVVFTGLSGSGKSSLAFDTIYAEGQRRYVESLSAYARQFLGQMEKPDVDIIEGLSPAISIDQKGTSKNPRPRLVGTIDTATRLGNGPVIIAPVDGPQDIHMSQDYICPIDGLSVPEPEPRNFSFNNPHGACPTCTGLGSQLVVDADLIVPDPSLSLREGAIAAWSRSQFFYPELLESVSKYFGIDMDKPWSKLAKQQQNVLLNGTGEKKIRFGYKNQYGHSRWYEAPFEGVVANLQRRYEETQSEYLKAELERYMSDKPCPACNGSRLKPESLAVSVSGHSIADVSRLSVSRAIEFFDHIDMTEREGLIARGILKEIRERLQFMIDVGLDYLTIERGANSLSGGESQRIRLATQIGSKLMGVLYILDEPSIGLHQRDNRRLINTLVGLRDLGNTLIVVEHDEETIRSADYMVDIGPAAGEHGGEIVAAGPVEKVLRDPRSITAAYLRGDRMIPVPARRRKGNGKLLVIRGAQANNPKDIDVTIPLGTFVAVSGVSGSGKSSLITDILSRKVAQHFYRAKERPGPHKAVEGLDQLDKAIDIDQSPIGRTPRSNPATYTGMFTHIRDLFASMPEAKMRGYKPGRFSFNVKGGRCEAC